MRLGPRARALITDMWLSKRVEGRYITHTPMSGRVAKAPWTARHARAELEDEPLAATAETLTLCPLGAVQRQALMIRTHESLPATPREGALAGNGCPLTRPPHQSGAGGVRQRCDSIYYISADSRARLSRILKPSHCKQRHNDPILTQ